MKIPCTICLEIIDTTTDIASALMCGHVYHQQCLQNCLSTSLTCPVCRSNVDTDKIVSKLFLEQTEITGVSQKVKDVFTKFDNNYQEFETSLLCIISTLENENKMLKQNIRSVTCEAETLRENLSKMEDKMDESVKLKDEVDTLKEILSVVKHYEDRNALNIPKIDASKKFFSIYCFNFKV